MRHENKYSGIILQIDSGPVSPEQLASEIKHIYGSLTTNEARCARVAREGYLGAKGDPRQWQTVIDAHSALINDHVEFFMVSQHPEAIPLLRGLATKYTMPARLWKHGIHLLLEGMRSKLPGSLEFMLSFVQHAYRMIGLFYETFPAFETTWMECLGDLARYRMAIEDDDLQAREIWRGVAISWYQKTAAAKPNVGRLSHHLAILARPDISEQLFLYAKSLTSIEPFHASRES
ncbi:uncharacterized protein BDZ99DRAFT_381951, partial [Mytilinidion resinicola]